MGYSIDVEMEVKIPLSKKNAVKKIFKDLAIKKNEYCWVDSGYQELTSVEEMFEAWRYSVSKTETHYVIDSFTGEKLGDDKILWKTMESVVTTDSFIEFHGEDGFSWKYIFKDNKLKEVSGKVIYE